MTKSAVHYEGNYGTHNPLVECIEIKGSSNLFLCDYSALAEQRVKEMDYPTPTLTAKEMADRLNGALQGFFARHLTGEED